MCFCNISVTFVVGVVFEIEFEILLCLLSQTTIIYAPPTKPQQYLVEDY